MQILSRLQDWLSLMSAVWTLTLLNANKYSHVIWHNSVDVLIRNHLPSPTPAPHPLTHGISASVLLEPPSIKVLFTFRVRGCLTADRSQSGKGLFSLIRFLGGQIMHTLFLSPGNLGHVCSSLPGKGLDLKDAMVCKEVSSCSATGIQDCGASLEGSSFRASLCWYKSIS